MTERNRQDPAEQASRLIRELGCHPFQQRPPWWGPDLQTLRDSLRPLPLPPCRARALRFPIGESACLVGLLDQPMADQPAALVLLVHGLGGSSGAPGVRRLAWGLQQHGLAVLRLNLRGAGPGRALAAGTYAADCSDDLLPVLRQARQLAGDLGGASGPLPLLGAGLSLGGTVLLNATRAALGRGEPGLDALICISSPLDLHSCTQQFERPRNHVYQRWLVERLRRQTLADPFGLRAEERQALSGAERPRTIRGFDALITVPRWGHASVEAYHAATSPQRWLEQADALPPTLLLHADDDPWVPAAPAQALMQRRAAGGDDQGGPLQLILTERGGHNGFHGLGDGPLGSWSDRLACRWLADHSRPA
ncbi:MAG: alpha/beta fold hydrolase [Cyanobium sp.]